MIESVKQVQLNVKCKAKQESVKRQLNLWMWKCLIPAIPILTIEKWEWKWIVKVNSESEKEDATQPKDHFTVNV